MLEFAAHAQTRASTPIQKADDCHVRPVAFDGWSAEEIANDWVKLTIVPQLGGRLMQVDFEGHPFLFVNPKYKGVYIPPAKAGANWVNYGGDKIWPMPEGNRDEHHWVLRSDPLDDGKYTFKILSQGRHCAVLLQGPADPTTGLQYRREISIGADSPAISFHATMTNSTGHRIAWAVQSVTQYDLSDRKTPGQYNPNFWAIAPVNPNSAYLDGYSVRNGLADDPSFSIRDGLFRLHWKYLMNEVWLDSTAGWIALVDGTSGYAMVEKFNHHKDGNYPGHATVIFYKNGPSVDLKGEGVPSIRPTNSTETPYYMEAELNSPIVDLQPGESYAMDTEWFPSRASQDVSGVTDAGIVSKGLAISRVGNSLGLSGTFGVFYAGKLVAHLYNRDGIETDEVPLQPVQPQDLAEVHRQVDAPSDIVRVSVHLVDTAGVDRGSIGDVSLAKADGGN